MFGYPGFAIQTLTEHSLRPVFVGTGAMLGAAIGSTYGPIGSFAGGQAGGALGGFVFDNPELFNPATTKEAIGMLGETLKPEDPFNRDFSKGVDIISGQVLQESGFHSESPEWIDALKKLYVDTDLTKVFTHGVSASSDKSDAKADYKRQQQRWKAAGYLEIKPGKYISSQGQEVDHRVPDRSGIKRVPYGWKS